MCFFGEIDPLTLKLKLEDVGVRRTKTIQKKRKKFGLLILPYFKIYCQPTVFKTLWYLPKDEHTHQRINIEFPKIDPHTYGQLIF